MATNSNIEWCDATWNPVVGCSRSSAGCDHCYAVAMTHRLEAMGVEKYKGLTVLNGRGDRHFRGLVRCDESALDMPLKWRKPRRVFVNSMSDLFHLDVPFSFIDKVFAIMALCQQHVFMILTKRPGIMRQYLYSRTAMHDSGQVYRSPQWYYVATDMLDDGKRSMPRGAWERGHNNMPAPWLPLPNVWLGASVENQDTADDRIPELIACAAAKRFLSIEPMLGRITLRVIGPGPQSSNPLPHIDLVIVGGESGPHARPSCADEYRHIIAQCRAEKTPVFVKQLGSAFADLPLKSPKGSDMAEWPEDLRVREWPVE